MVSKKDLLCMFQYLDGNVSALEDELKELRKDLDKVKRNNKCKVCPKKCEKKEVKRGRGRPRKNA